MNSFEYIFVHVFQFYFNVFHDIILHHFTSYVFVHPLVVWHTTCRFCSSLEFAHNVVQATNTPVHLQSRQDGTLFDDSGTAFVERDSP